MTAPPPLNVTQLNDRLSQVAAEWGIPVARARIMLCTLIVSQMLPDAAVIKCGMGVKLRIGERGTRATADFDVSTRARGEAFQREFSARLSAGWGTVPPSKGALKRDPHAPPRVASTATVRALDPFDPGLELPEYVMHPYRVSIAFLGSAWGGLDVEVSDPEIEAEAPTPAEVDPDLAEFGARFGFGDFLPVQLVAVEYQIAQKLHAVSDLAYFRPHDLVDLQLLWGTDPDLAEVRRLCVRTFDFRRQQAWPPLPLRGMDGWGSAYADARAETLVNGATSILEDVVQARGWLARVIGRIESDGADQRATG